MTRETLQSKQFEIDYSQEEVEKILRRFGQLHYLLKAGLLPLAEAKKSEEKQWMCKYCEYSEKCERNEA